ncbi:Zinc finger CCCH domain-containing protein [Dionaea muscipula]
MWRKLMMNQYIHGHEELPRTLGPRAQLRYLTTVEQREEYESDEFRMYTFKIKRCGVHRSHDWTMCPFAHKGEKARRRDPRRINYVAITCPQYRLGYCPKAEQCEFAHGVFEYWLHPARYRTRICTGGASCCRRVCFFAHSLSQLRPETRYRCTYYHHPIHPLIQSPHGITTISSTSTAAAAAFSDHPAGLLTGVATAVRSIAGGGFSVSCYPISTYHNTGAGGARVTTYYGGHRSGGGARTTVHGSSGGTNYHDSRGGDIGAGDGGSLCFVLGADGVVVDDDKGYGGGTYYEEKPVELKLEFLESLRRLTNTQRKQQHHIHEHDHDHGGGGGGEVEGDLEKCWGGVNQWDVPDLGWISEMLSGM